MDTRRWRQCGEPGRREQRPGTDRRRAHNSGHLTPPRPTGPAPPSAPRSKPKRFSPPMACAVTGSNWARRLVAAPRRTAPGKRRTVCAEAAPSYWSTAWKWIAAPAVDRQRAPPHPPTWCVRQPRKHRNQPSGPRPAHKAVTSERSRSMTSPVQDRYGAQEAGGLDDELTLERVGAPGHTAPGDRLACAGLTDLLRGQRPGAARSSSAEALRPGRRGATAPRSASPGWRANTSTTPGTTTTRRPPSSPPRSSPPGWARTPGTPSSGWNGTDVGVLKHSDRMATVLEHALSKSVTWARKIGRSRHCWRPRGRWRDRRRSW